jgi:hypothetical protein
VYRDVGVGLGEWFWTLMGIAAVAIDVLLELYPVTDTVWLPSASVAEFQATQQGGKAVDGLDATHLPSTNTLIQLTSGLSDVAIVVVPPTVAPAFGAVIVT